MPVANPARFFINGFDERVFTYEGGSTLFSWSPYDSGLSTSMESNVMFFANDEDHARDVLRRLFEFWVECNDLYVHDKKSDREDCHGFVERTEEETRALKRYLENIDQMKFGLVPVNQVYKVAWTCNDGLGLV